MARVEKDQREVLDEALAIGTAVEREKSRHRNASEKMMVRAAKNVYEAHLVGIIDARGFTPRHGGEEGREEARAAAAEGKLLTAKSYGLVIGFSEAYISRLYRLGFGMAAGVLDPDEQSGNGPTRWQIISRTLGDTPEVGDVLGKDVAILPTHEALEDAIRRATERKAEERAAAAAAAAEMPEGPIPRRPSDQIDLLQDLVGTLRNGRHLTPRQIERVQSTMDEIRQFIEEWMQEEGPTQQVAASQ